MIRCMREAAGSIMKQPGRSAAAAVAAALLLILFGLLSLAFQNLHYVTAAVEKNIDVKVFLKEGTDPENMAQMLEKDLQSPVRVITKEQGLKDMLAFYEKEEYLETLRTDNPLNDVIVIYPETLQTMKKSVQVLERYKEVEAVYDNGDYYEKFSGITEAVRTWGGAAAAGFGAGTLFLTGVVISTGFTVRKREIHVMYMLGASPAFIRRPYLMEGIFLGAGGGLTAAACVHYMYEKLYVLSEAAVLPPDSFWGTAGILMIAGTAAGGGGSLAAVLRLSRT
ncbi:MAG: FtsX-like permease family protein [Alkalicoccus sp.]|nr:MAG: FtsX-like permease family protein [Alkalicoccus sp.]